MSPSQSVPNTRRYKIQLGFRETPKQDYANGTMELQLLAIVSEVTLLFLNAYCIWY